MTPSDFAAAARVSRETLERLEKYDALLLERNARMNLVARSTIADRWRRHYLDSAQLFALIPPAAKSLVDLGSGAGFPGLILAAMGRERGLKVLLVESVKKKAAFLRDAAAAMGLDNVEVYADRIESLKLKPPDIVTARALAALPALLAYAHEITGKNTICLFLKGQDVGVELTEAARYWHMAVERRPSATANESSVLVIRNLTKKASRAPRV